MKEALAAVVNKDFATFEKTIKEALNLKGAVLVEAYKPVVTAKILAEADTIIKHVGGEYVFEDGTSADISKADVKAFVESFSALDEYHEIAKELSSSAETYNEALSVMGIAGMSLAAGTLANMWSDHKQKKAIRETENNTPHRVSVAGHPDGIVLGSSTSYANENDHSIKVKHDDGSVRDHSVDKVQYHESRQEISPKILKEQIFASLRSKYVYAPTLKENFLSFGKVVNKVLDNTPQPLKVGSRVQHNSGRTGRILNVSSDGNHDVQWEDSMGPHDYHNHTKAIPATELKGI